MGNALSARLAALGVARLGCELSYLPAIVASTVPVLVDIESTIRALRELKDADELEAITSGIRTAAAVHAHSRELLRAGLTELEYYASLVERATVAAGEPFVMMCDLVSGSRTIRGSGGPSERVMTHGDLVILDTFPYVGGYRGDIANTLVVGGRPTSEQEDRFRLVLEALSGAERLLRPGTPVREIFKAIDTCFRASGPGRRLVHHAGHAIGLGHPEAPELVPESDRTLEAGMVITLEPGLYEAPLGGVRVEHDYLITPQGYERLSNHRLGLA